MVGVGPPWWMWSKELAEFQRQGIWPVWIAAAVTPPLVDQPRVIVFDYLTVLKNGGFAPNPLIYDGDSIRVHKATAPINVIC